MIFTYSTSKLNGVLIIMSITKHNVFTHIISKILDANQTYLDTIPSSAKIGSLAPLLLATKRGANVWKNVLKATGGKNNSFTL